MELMKIAGAAALTAALLAAPALADQHDAYAPDAQEASPGLEEPAAKAPEQSPAPEAPAAKTPESAAAAEMPRSQGSVARAGFTLEVVDREPTAEVSRLTNDHDRVLFFTELHRFQGQELVHRWEYDGEVKAEVPFGIDGPRWRVYSSKALDPSWLGTWTVTVVDAEGNTVEQQTFDYVAAPEPVASAEDSAEIQPGPAAMAE